jgi:hypothetical protein
MSLQELMRRVQHPQISDQVGEINAALRGRYAYYGVAGKNLALSKEYLATERYWYGMLRSRSWAAGRLTWDAFHQLRERMPLLRPNLRLPYRELQALASSWSRLHMSRRALPGLRQRGCTLLALSLGAYVTRWRRRP